MVEGTNRPEKIQAWTVSAILAINTARKLGKIKTKSKIPQTNWQKDLEKTILSNIPHVQRIKSNKALLARYPVYPYALKKRTLS